MNITKTFNGFSRKMKGVFGFLREVKIQLKKVDWPSVTETLRYTAVVVISAMLLAVFLGGVDFMFTLFLNRLVI